MVRKKGFEPSRPCGRQPLKLVRLPVPPLPRGLGEICRVGNTEATRTGGCLSSRQVYGRRPNADNTGPGRPGLRLSAMSATRRAWHERVSWLRGNWRLLLEATGLAIGVEIALRLLPFSRVLARVRSRAGPTRQPPAHFQVTGVERAVRWVYRVIPVTSTCLRSSLVLCDMLTRRGVRAELRIGVRKTSDGVAAHAWVEDGMGVMLTDPLAGFVPLPWPRPSPSLVSRSGP
jgi:hypothetical protein